MAQPCTARLSPHYFALAELKPPDAADVDEELARIRLTFHDDAGALPFLEEALTGTSGGDKTGQELWLLRADIATRLNDWQRIADSLERAFALGNLSSERRTALVRIYMTHRTAPRSADRALFHIRSIADQLPMDAKLRAEYATYLDELTQPEEALQAWRRALQADPQMEAAHYRVTRLLIRQEHAARGARRLGDWDCGGAEIRAIVPG